MKNVNQFRTIPLLLAIVLHMISCTSTNIVFLTELKLKDNPDFIKNAHEYIIEHPITSASTRNIWGHTPKIQTFVIEDIQTKDDYQIKTQWVKETERRLYAENSFITSNYRTYVEFMNIKRQRFTNISDIEEDDIGRGRDFILHKIDISNPVDNNDYEIFGEITFFEKKTMGLPVEFWIFEQNKNVGMVKIDDPFDSSYPALKVDISIHDKLFKVEFEENFIQHKRKVSVEYEDQLVAFFDLKLAAFISTKMKGNILIKPGLAKDFLADIFSSYLMAAIIRRAIKGK
jgi:hypothetical protein